MSKKRFTSLLSLSILSALMLSSHVQAQIPTRAFKNVTKHFKPGQEFNSPTFGEAALYSGLIANLRFYGNMKPSFKEGTRLYIGDKGGDPIAKLIKELFPSPTGALNVETTAQDNFGRYVHQHETVALLLNFAHKIRKNKKPFRLKEISTHTEGILATLSDFSDDNRNKLRTKINGILKSIQDSIIHELDSPYPKYFTEEVINAFFSEKFSIQNDIWRLLRAMGDELVDKTNIPQEVIVEGKVVPPPEDLVEVEDLDSIANKEGAYDADDIFALENADIFEMVTPYKPGTHLLSNGNTRPYDRKTDQYVLSKELFADCAEMAARHIMSLLLFNRGTQQFDLSHLKSTIKEDNPYFKNFEQFYKEQKPLLANAGDTDMRSFWARVLGDLNTDDDPIKISYLKETYELNAGYINFVRVFQKIFGLTLDELPDDANLEGKTKWLQKSLTTLFKTVNPTREYEFDLSTVKEDGHDLSGNLQIIVKDQADTDIFSFVYYTSVKKHSEIRNLQVPAEDIKYDFTQQLQDHPTTMEEGTVEDTLWLLKPELKKTHSDFYNVFSERLADNHSRIRALKKIQSIDKNSKFALLLPVILKNILADISWDDESVLCEASSVVSDMMKDPHFQPIVAETVKSYLLENNDDLTNPHFKALFEEITTLYVEKGPSSLEGLEVCQELKSLKLSQSVANTLVLKTLKNLETLTLVTGQNLKELSVENLGKLINVHLSFSFLETITLKNLPCLETLSLEQNQKLEELSLENLDKLKELDLGKSDVKTVVLKNLSSLGTLNLTATQSLEELSLENLPQLKSLDLTYSQLKTIQGLNTLTNLETLKLHDNYEFEELSLKNLSHLKSLDVKGLPVKIINGLNTLSNLETFKLENNYVLEEISVENLGTLKNFSLKGSTVKIIKGLNTLASLENLDLSDTHGVEELFLENLDKLTNINLFRSGVKKVGFKSLSSLEKLRLGAAKNLEEVVLENLGNLKQLVFNSNVKTLSLANLDGLESLDFRSLPQLERIDFRGSFKNLKSISFENAPKILQIDGLEDLVNLETVTIKGKNVNRLEIQDKAKRFRPSARVTEMEE